MSTSFRTLLFWTHLTAGVLAGLVILKMSVTGVLLMYERQLIEWSDRGFRSTIPSDGTARLPIETLLSRVVEQREGTPPTAITLRADPAAPATIAIGAGSVYQDVYTGAVLGEPATRVRSLMSELRVWHR